MAWNGKVLSCENVGNSAVDAAQLSIWSDNQ